jgi:general nucleoside transport system ATP-binding protein
VALRAVCKRFPGVVACDSVSLAIHAGEVHALLGENGAGKSTLVAMLAGTQRPDDGTVCIDGVAATLSRPAQALAFGIDVVAQHAKLVPTLTVTENLLLGGRWWQAPDRAATASHFRETCRGFGIAIDPAARAGDLTPGEQRQVEIVRALWRGGRVLVLDEPTAPLGPAASTHLLTLLRGLKLSGLAVVLITHRLDEALLAADRVTVLRRGRVTGSLGPDELRATPHGALTERIRHMMFAGAAPDDPHPPPRSSHRKPALDVRGLTVTGRKRLQLLADVTLAVARGEILGVAGIDGNGQGVLAEALAGHVLPDSGSITLDGVAIQRLSVAERHRRGLRYLSDDRIGEGSVGAFPVAINLLMKQIGASPFWRHGMQRDAAIGAYAESLMSAYDVRAPSPWTKLSALSGGNIQKVMLARELHGAPRLIVYHKPMVGLDVHSAEATHRRIRQAASAGAASLVISADLDELLALADRIAVLRAGRIVATLQNGTDARRQIAEAMLQ